VGNSWWSVSMSGFVSGFFVQAEDGIRDRNVTGVQTCALPISIAPIPLGKGKEFAGHRSAELAGLCEAGGPDLPGKRGYPCCEGRSEESRVGKECRCRWWPEHGQEMGQTYRETER